MNYPVDEGYPVLYDDPLNPRLNLRAGHLERTFNLLEIAEDMEDEAGDILKLLGECFPTGSQRDARGATSKQLHYIIHLANMKQEEEISRFMRMLFEAGGISVVQASFIIEKLKGVQRRPSN